MFFLHIALVKKYLIFKKITRSSFIQEITELILDKTQMNDPNPHEFSNNPITFDTYSSLFISDS